MSWRSSLRLGLALGVVGLRKFSIQLVAERLRAEDLVVPVLKRIPSASSIDGSAARRAPVTSPRHWRLRADTGSRSRRRQPRTRRPSSALAIAGVPAGCLDHHKSESLQIAWRRDVRLDEEVSAAVGASRVRYIGHSPQELHAVADRGIRDGALDCFAFGAGAGDHVVHVRRHLRQDVPDEPGVPLASDESPDRERVLEHVVGEAEAPVHIGTCSDGSAIVTGVRRERGDRRESIVPDARDRATSAGRRPIADARVARGRMVRTATGYGARSQVRSRPFMSAILGMRNSASTGHMIRYIVVS